ncbi:MAG: peroxiredoxin [Leptospirales bacterium]|nr:peroxiredoxin [Leptospirales bacterium]
MAKKSKKSPSKKSKKSASRKAAPRKKIIKKKKVARPVKKTAPKKVKKKTAKKSTKPAKVVKPKAVPAIKPTAPAKTSTAPATKPQVSEKPAVVYPTRIEDRPVQLTNGQTVQLSSLTGTNGLVLYFYPKDDTPGCTVEACNFRDTESALKNKGWNVVGVSPDSAAAHQKFTAKHSLNFPLIADEDHSLCEASKVWQEKSMYGKSYMGVARTTFLLDTNLNVKKVYERVRPEGHADEILEDVS